MPSATAKPWSKLKLTLPLLAATLLLPTGCATSTPPSPEQQARVLYQPPTLSLKAGLPITTTQGIYTPQVDELWYSSVEMQKANDEVTQLSAALQQKSLTKP